MKRYQTAAFILNSKSWDYEIDEKGERSLEVILYAKSPELGVIKIVINQISAFILVAKEQDIPTLSGLIFKRDLEIKSFENKKPLQALYFSNLESWRKAQKVFDEAGIEIYGTQTLPDECFLSEKFINSQCQITGEAQQEEKYLTFYNPNLEPASCQVKFKVLSLDIETGVKTDQIYSIAGHVVRENSHEEQKVFMLSNQDSQVNDYLSYYSTEDLLLKSFLHWFKELDPDVIIGWYVIGFDLDFLERKFRQFHIPFSLGRDDSYPKLISLASGLNIANIAGRIVIDGIDYFKLCGKKFDNYKLETVAQACLDEGKLIDDSTEDKITQIENLFENDKVSLAKYNIQDCALVSRLFAKEKVLDFYIYLSKISGVLIPKLSRENLIFNNLYIPYLHRKGYSSARQKKSDKSGQSILFTKVAEKKLYKNVLRINFESFVLQVCKSLKLDPLAYKYSEETAILSNLFKKLKEISLLDKQDGALSLAVSHTEQILVKQLYGYNSLFYNIDLVTVLSTRIKEIMQLVEKFLSQEMNSDIIYADCQNLFCSNIEGENQESLVEKISQIIGKELGEESFKISSSFFYKKFINYTDQKEKRLKFYACLVNDDSQLHNLSISRRLPTNLLNFVRDKILQKIINDQNPKLWVKEFVDQLQKAEHNEKLFYNRKVNKKAYEYKDNPPIEVVAAMQLEQFPMNVSYIIDVDDKPIVKEFFENQQVNYKHYINRIKPLVNDLLVVINSNYQQCIENHSQLNLFS